MSSQAQAGNLLKLKELLKEIQFCMFTTVSKDDSSLRSRPMTLQKFDQDNTLWFFTDVHGEIISDIETNKKLNLTFAHPGKSSYVSVKGEGECVRDHNKIKELFNPAVKAWFPDGPEDKNIALVKCTIQSADYWDSPSSTLVQLYAFAKAVITGQRPGEELGVHKHVDIH